MDLLEMSNQLCLTFILSLVFLFIIRKGAKKIALVDKPNTRKQHDGDIPIVGGLAIYCTMVIVLYTQIYPAKHIPLYFFCSAILVVIGAVDDRFDISVKLRAGMQAAVACLMMYHASMYLSSLGFILGPVELKVGIFGYLLTLLAVWAAINAFNMIDGIDGLLGSLSCVTFLGLGILLLLKQQNDLAFWCFAMIAATLPFLLLNLNVMGRRFKVFMGDAGSTMVGFTVIWVILASTQGQHSTIHPVTALWLIAIPLMDMVAIMYRRIRSGSSPFSADRQHLHHILMDAGFSPRQTCVIITLVSLIMVLIGFAGEWAIMPEWGMFILFICLFIGYSYIRNHSKLLLKSACYLNGK